MVERVVAGRQPPELTAQALRTSRLDITMGWAAQSEPSDLPRRYEPAPIDSGQATALLLLVQINIVAIAEGIGFLGYCRRICSRPLAVEQAPHHSQILAELLSR